MKRPPFLASLIVTLAVALMIALGLWQLSRMAEKEAAIASYRANLNRGDIAFPRLPPVGEDQLFRKSAVTCLSVADWTVEAGRTADGDTGFRVIAHCVTGAEGPGALVVLGVADRPDVKPAWSGGTVHGTITTARDTRNLFARSFGRGAPPAPMLVSDSGLAGLKAPARPDPASVPNNHLAYAVQWFLFAATALIIYLLAWRRKLRDAAK